jgi:putative DNA primase/helicase
MPIDVLVHRLLVDPAAYAIAQSYEARLRKAISWPKHYLRDEEETEQYYTFLNLILQYGQQFGKAPDNAAALSEFCKNSKEFDISRTWSVSLEPTLNDFLEFAMENQERFVKAFTDTRVLIARVLEKSRQKWYRYESLQFNTIALSGPTKKDAFGNKKDPSGCDDAKQQLIRRLLTMDFDSDEAMAKGEAFYSSGDKTFYIAAADSIKPETIVWIWQGRLPKGMLCILSGNAGIGKSFVITYIVSRVTTGRDWDDGTKNTLPPSTVLLACAEDDPARTVVPRLMAQGADLSRVKFLLPVKATEFVKHGRDEKLESNIRELQLAADLDALKAMLKANPDIAIVVFDPITGFFGCDSSKDKELRPVMNRLKDVCEETGVAVLAISHHSKKSDVDALQKILGASSFTGAARAVWSFSRDSDDNDIRHMAIAKMNVDEPAKSLKFTVKTLMLGDLKTGTVEWLGETNETADTLLQKSREKAREGGAGIDKALVYLTAKFNDNSQYKCTELYAEAEREGISEDQLKRARRKLPFKTDFDKRKDGWWLAREPKPEAQMQDVDDQAFAAEQV